MLTVGFFGLMRIGELTMSKDHFVPIQFNQLTFTPHLVSINITHFKHNQKLKPVEIPLPRQSLVEVCPVYHLALYISLRGYQDGPLFAFPSLSPVPRQFFSKNLSRLIFFSGFKGKDTNPIV